LAGGQPRRFGDFGFGDAENERIRVVLGDQIESITEFGSGSGAV
jgi:hypothetical protein